MSNLEIWITTGKCINPSPVESKYTLFWKQCASWSAGFFRSQLIWMDTVFNTTCHLMQGLNWLEKLESVWGKSMHLAGQYLSITRWKMHFTFVLLNKWMYQTAFLFQDSIVLFWGVCWGVRVKVEVLPFTKFAQHLTQHIYFSWWKLFMAYLPYLIFSCSNKHSSYFSRPNSSLITQISLFLSSYVNPFKHYFSSYRIVWDLH